MPALTKDTIPSRRPILPLAALLSIALSGCAAPIKAFLQQDQSLAAVPAGVAPASDPDAALRAGLKARAMVMLAAKAPQAAAKPHPEAMAAPSPAGKTGAATPSPAVRAMLASLRTTPQTLPNARLEPARLPADAAPLAPSPLAQQFHVKDNTRFSTSPEGSKARQAPQAMLHFAEGAAELDADGNRILAGMTEKTGLAPSARIIIIAGLSGTAQPWERMRIASKRIETISRHVPPPLVVEHRFDPALDGNQIRLELGEARR